MAQRCSVSSFWEGPPGWETKKQLNEVVLKMSCNNFRFPRNWHSNRAGTLVPEATLILQVLATLRMPPFKRDLQAIPNPTDPARCGTSEEEEEEPK